jgi:predicted lipid-binding transport protein (Tim44 family)
MRDVFDIYTIIFLALAVFIFLRLRSVLGQRTGRERPPYDPYSARDAMRPAS